MKYQIIPVTAFSQNCTLLWCDITLEGVLVDPGGEAQRLIQYVEKSGVKLTHLLLTHGHVDHVGAAQELSKHYGIPVWGPQKNDAFWLEDLPDQSRMFGIGDCDVLVPDRWLQEGDEIPVGDLCLQVLHTPGHTPGHVVFVEQQVRLALVGDVLFKGGVGRSDFAQGDHATLIRSIREKLLPLGDDITFIPGHGPLSTFGHEHLHNPFLQDELPIW